MDRAPDNVRQTSNTVGRLASSFIAGVFVSLGALSLPSIGIFLLPAGILLVGSGIWLDWPRRGLVLRNLSVTGVAAAVVVGLLFRPSLF